MKTTTHQQRQCQCRYGIHADPDKLCKGQPQYLVEHPDGTRTQLCGSCRLTSHKTLHDFRDGAYIESYDDDATHEAVGEHDDQRLYTEAEVAEFQASEGKLVQEGMQRKLDEVTSHRDQLLGQVAGLRAGVSLMRRERDDLRRERDELRVSYNEAITEKARLMWRLSQVTLSVDEVKAQRDKAEQELSSLKGAIADIVDDHDII